MPSATTPAPRTRRFPRWVVAVMIVAACGAALAAGSWLVGPTPKPPAAPDARPPLVVVPGPQSDQLEKAAELLSKGKERSAERAFAALAVARPTAVEPQVGIALSRWDRLGADAVIADLTQIERENPGDAYIGLHLGIANLALGGLDAEGRRWLSKAQVAAAKTGQWKLWSSASDLIHPERAPGSPPIVIPSGTWELPAAQRDQLAERMGKLVESGNRPALEKLAQQQLRELKSRQAPHVRAAMAAAAWSKDDPEPSMREAQQLAKSAGGLPQLQYGLLLIWMGDQETGLGQIRAAQADPEAAELATKLLATSLNR